MLMRATRVATRSPPCPVRSAGARGYAGPGRASPTGLPPCYGRTPVPQRGPRGGRKLRSGVDRRTVEAPESARGDNAPRDRIALGGGAAVSAAHLHAHLDELDTGSPKIIAVRLAQLAQCIYVVWRQSSGEAGAIPASCLCKCQIGSAHAGRPPRPGVAVSDSW
jgi:hypothetical protein